jgi:hypothetical protein
MRAGELFRPMIRFEAVTPAEREDCERWFRQIGTSKQENATDMQLSSAAVLDDSLRTAIKPICWGFNTQTLLEAIEDIRMQAAAFVDQPLSDMPATRIGAVFIPRLSATMHAIFTDEAEDAQMKYTAFGSSWTRKLYAAAAPVQFPKYCESATLPAFVSEILMHTPGVPKTSVFYASITFISPDEATEERKKRREEGEDKTKAKKKKRKTVPTPQASALWGKTTITVSLKGIGGGEVVVNKWSHGKFNTQEDRMQYFDDVSAYLTEMRVKPSIANLKAIGVSQKFQRDRKYEKKGLPIPSKKPKKDKGQKTIEECVQAPNDGSAECMQIQKDIEAEADGTDDEEFDQEEREAIGYGGGIWNPKGEELDEDDEDDDEGDEEDEKDEPPVDIPPVTPVRVKRKDVQREAPIPLAPRKRGAPEPTAPTTRARAKKQKK